MPLDELPVIASRRLDGQTRRRYRWRPRLDLRPGDYRLELNAHGGGHAIEGGISLIVAPRRCFVPADLDQERLWGLSAQLYALRSADDWGMGGFSELARLADAGRPARRGRPRRQSAACPLPGRSRPFRALLTVQPAVPEHPLHRRRGGARARPMRRGQGADRGDGLARAAGQGAHGRAGRLRRGGGAQAAGSGTAVRMVSRAPPRR